MKENASGCFFLDTVYIQVYNTDEAHMTRQTNWEQLKMLNFSTEDSL